MIFPMRVKIDAAGRIVIPRQMRRRLGVEGAGEVEINDRADRLEIRPAPTPMRTARSSSGVLVLQPEQELPTMTGDAVRDAVERTRQARENG